MSFRTIYLTLCFAGFIAATAHAQEVRGEASYYADKLNGRPTATGEIYDKNALTCANKDFPVGSILRVTRIDDGRYVDVRVNDCGPHRKGRVVDLSRAAAEKIGLIRDGITQVELKLMALGTQGFACDRSKRAANPTVTPTSYGNVSMGRIATAAPSQVLSKVNYDRFWVQFGVYKQVANAQTQFEVVQQSGLENLQVVKDGKLFRIVAGPYTDRFSAEALKYYLEKEKKMKGMVTKL